MEPVFQAFPSIPFPIEWEFYFFRPARIWQGHHHEFVLLWIKSFVSGGIAFQFFPGNGAVLCHPWGLTEPFVSTRPSFALQFVRGRVLRWRGRWRPRPLKLRSLSSKRLWTVFGGFLLATSLLWQNWEGMIWLHALVKSLRTKSISFSTLAKKRLAKPIETNWGAELS